MHIDAWQSNISCAKENNNATYGHQWFLDNTLEWIQFCISKFVLIWVRFNLIFQYSA